MTPSQRHRAIAQVTVLRSEATAFDESAKPVLKDVVIEERFTGDIEGASTVHALQVSFGKDSASMTSVQRVNGRIGRRTGSFVLRGEEAIDAGKIRATWYVVPGSGTGELTGLRGEGGFKGQFGQGSEATLDYWFE